jgi:hypothetical protein
MKSLTTWNWTMEVEPLLDDREFQPKSPWLSAFLATATVVVPQLRWGLLTVAQLAFLATAIVVLRQLRLGLLTMAQSAFLATAPVGLPKLRRARLMVTQSHLTCLFSLLMG